MLHKNLGALTHEVNRQEDMLHESEGKNVVKAWEVYNFPENRTPSVAEIPRSRSG